MKQLKLIVLGLALVSVAAPALALGPLDVNADLALNSKYVWRGIVASPDMVIQPAVGVSFLGFGLGVWGNMDTSDYNGTESQFNELDYTLSYGLSLPLVSLGIGLIYYDFVNVDFDDTTELYLSASVGVILSPSLIVYQDIDQFKGAYWEFGIGHGFPLSPTIDLDFSANLGLGSEGYLKGYFGAIPDPEIPNQWSSFTGASMSDFRFGATLPWKAVPFITITPGAFYSTLLGDSKSSAEGYGDDTDAFVYGITASFSF